MDTAGARLRDARRAAGFTQEQLAHEVEVTTSTIQKLEAGRSIPRVGLALRLAHVLNSTAEALFGAAA